MIVSCLQYKLWDECLFYSILSRSVSLRKDKIKDKYIISVTYECNTPGERWENTLTLIITIFSWLTRQLSWSHQIFSRDIGISHEHSGEKERVNDTRDYNVRIYVRKQLRESRPSSAFREVLQTQLRSPVETRPIHTYETALVIFRYNVFELLHFVFVYSASRALSLLRAWAFVFLEPSFRRHGKLCSSTSSL